MMEYAFLIVGIIFGLLFGLLVGVQAGASYITKRLEEIDRVIESKLR